MAVVDGENRAFVGILVDRVAVRVAADAGLTAKPLVGVARQRPRTASSFMVFCLCAVNDGFDDDDGIGSIDAED